ncbi:hypothetical protein [Luteimonas sp. R10]|uniref:hypothetical protein n=1 Tax=Luteimonas sp. R10 TaxID=3108176 RepID=UPI00308C008B|nr:hypothetical protein U3649_18640 [Luteimonas sp. R10]
MSRHLLFLLLCGLVLASPLPGAAAGDSAAAGHDGRHDFDFEFGTWTTHLRRLRNPLSGSTEWVEYMGTTTVRKLLGGRANTAELVVEGEAGHIEGVALRLYDPQARQWRIHYANVADGELTGPVTGAFRDGRGEFYGEETIDGRAVLVRFVISGITADSCRFEQAFSVDGGRTWEVNWIATDTRAPNDP